jgi:hypothetical protein
MHSSFPPSIISKKIHLCFLSVIKLFVLSVLFLSLLSCEQSEYFQGEIKYRITITPDSAKIDSVLLKDHYGKEWEFLYKNGNFVWNMTGNELFKTIYKKTENRYYYFLKDSKVLGWKSGNKTTDSIISIKNLSGKSSILGHPCDVLELKTILLSERIKRTRHYFYAQDFKVNPKWYLNNLDGNFNEVYKRTKSIPLKIVDDYGEFKIEYEAIKISRTEIKILNLISILNTISLK